jgi:uncharacterized membrane protein
LTLSHDKTDAAGEGSPAVFDSELPQDAPVYQVTLWPNRSLSRRGFRRLMLIVGAGLAIPVIPFLGGPVGWALAPFALGALGLLWFFLKRNYRDGRLTEELSLWPGLLAVTRREPSGEVRRWRADPYWVRLEVRETPTVEHYITLSAKGRTIELGAFLSPEERLELADELRGALAALPGQSA